MSKRGSYCPPDKCYETGGPKCEGRCAQWLCGPNEGAKTCESQPKSCPLGGKISEIVDGVVRLRPPGPVAYFEEERRPFDGQKVDAALVARMSVNVRRTLCGTASMPCMLHWNDAKNAAECRIDEDACSACVYRFEKRRCLAKPRYL